MLKCNVLYSYLAPKAVFERLKCVPVCMSFFFLMLLILQQFSRALKQSCAVCRQKCSCSISVAFSVACTYSPNAQVNLLLAVKHKLLGPITALHAVLTGDTTFKSRKMARKIDFLKIVVSLAMPSF